MKYKEGDILVSKEGNKSKVLGVCGQVYLMSHPDEFDRCSNGFTEQELDELGFTIDQSAWEPKEGDTYFWVDSAGKCYESVWRNDIIDNGRKNFLGVYQTEEACEQAIKDIKSKLGK